MNAQDLKNSILQLAIQGKLVEQRKEEGTAKELIEEIKAEKERLIKEKKIKKEKPLAEITEDEVPFDIPESWEWVRLSDLCMLVDGIKVQNVSLPYLEARYIRGKCEAQIKNSGKYVDKNQYVILVDGENSGEVFLTNEEGILGSTFKILNISKLIYDEYLIKLLNYYQKLFRERKRGAAIPHLDKNLFKNLVVGLPPLKEQKRIVAQIEELMPYVEKYGVAHSKLEKFNKKFPEDMEKSILQYAIQGKLVEQREEEGTAEELYKQIQEEKEKLIKEKKIKKEKPLAKITEDEVPFEIPGSWKWVRFGDIINLLSGQDFQPDQYNDQYKGIPYITGASSLSDEGVIVNRWTETPRCLANAGDILLVCKGSGYGKTVMCDIEEAHIARQIMSIKYFEFMNMSYIKWFLKANISLIKEKGQGVIPGIDRKSVQNMLFPLPPLAEQKRIVAKIEEMLPYCKQLVK